MLAHRQRLVIITGPHRTQKTQTFTETFHSQVHRENMMILERKDDSANSVVHSGRSVLCETKY